MTKEQIIKSELDNVLTEFEQTKKLTSKLMEIIELSLVPNKQAYDRARWNFKALTACIILQDIAILAWLILK